jgi:hypothetical protein
MEELQASRPDNITVHCRRVKQNSHALSTRLKHDVTFPRVGFDRDMFSSPAVFVTLSTDCSFSDIIPTLRDVCLLH